VLVKTPKNGREKDNPSVPKRSKLVGGRKESKVRTQRFSWGARAPKNPKAQAKDPKKGKKKEEKVKNANEIEEKPGYETQNRGAECLKGEKRDSNPRRSECETVRTSKAEEKIPWLIGKA